MGDKFTVNIEDSDGNPAATIEFTATTAGTYTSSQLAKALAEQGTVTLKDTEDNDREFDIKADGKKLIFSHESKNDFNSPHPSASEKVSFLEKPHQSQRGRAKWPAPSFYCF